MKRKTSKGLIFVPVFFIWLTVYSIIENIFFIANMKPTVFVHLPYGYNISIKEVISFIFQSVVLSGFFYLVFKEKFLYSLIKGVLISGFLYIFLYILLTGVYLKL